MDREGVPDAELVRRTRDGDREAFGCLVRRLLRPGLAVAWEFVQAREDAEDLVQEAFYRSLRRLDRYDENRPFAPWFFTIVRNLARNHASSRGRWRLVELPEEMVADAKGGSDAAECREIRERIDTALEALSNRQRACFRLCELEGFSRSEVADMLNLSEPTVRVHVHRARRSLRASLDVFRDEAATP